MRIAFDGTTLRPRRTGVGYYTEHLLRHLALEAPDDEITVVSNRPIDTTSALPARVRVASSGWRTPSLVWMQMCASRALDGLRADVAHFTNGMVPINTSTPTVVTIHDMSLTLFRSTIRRGAFCSAGPLSTLRPGARMPITVSESARRDTLRLSHLSPDRVHVIHEAARALVSAGVRSGRARTRSASIRTCGPRRPARRDHRAAEEPAEPDRRLCFTSPRRDLNHQLVCVGPYGWLSRGLARMWNV